MELSTLMSLQLFGNMCKSGDNALTSMHRSERERRGREGEKKGEDRGRKGRERGDTER